MTLSEEEKLKKLEEKKKKVIADIRKTRHKVAKKNRDKDTRKKILIGSAVLEKVKKGEWPEDRVIDMIDIYLKNKNDRILFGLNLNDE
jgi:hypothetical protein